MSHYKKDKIIKSILVAVSLVVCGALFYTAYVLDNKEEPRLQEINAKALEAEKNEEEIMDARVAILSDTISKRLPGVVCWGDSLTAGAGGDGTSYPVVLQNLIQKSLLDTFDTREVLKHSRKDYTKKLPAVKVVNMGVGGENTTTILGRNGAIPFEVKEDFTIPANTDTVKIALKSSNGKNVAPLRQGKAGMDYVIINGVKGVISIEQESYISKDYSYYFQRTEAGESVSVKAGTKIITSGSETNLNYIPVIFIGENGGYDDIPDLIKQQRAVIKHQQGNPLDKNGEARFIIIGLHTGTAESRAALEAAMETEYGKKYINLRKYMSEKALSDAGITATSEDRAMMGKGSTPSSLLSDAVHFTPKGYELIGNLIYERMDELGYFDEVKEAINESLKPLE